MIARQKIDLTIVGSRGHGAVERLLVGSTSARVVNEAPCSVLDRAIAAPQPSGERTILLSELAGGSPRRSFAPGQARRLTNEL